MTITKTKKSIEHLENMYFTKMYQVRTGPDYINSTITYDQKEGSITFTQNMPSESFGAIFKAKSHEKAVNLLLRAEKEFKAFAKRGSVPTLSIMKDRYSNYCAKA